MSFKAGSIVGELRLEDGQWVASLKESSKGTESLTGSVFKASLAVDAFKKVLSASLNITKKAIKNAIDFNETQNKFQVIYKKGTKTYNDAIKAQKNLTKNYGLSRQAATEMLSATGDLLTGLGFSADAALDLSEQVQELAVDLASFQNIEGGAERASEALTKAILGETEMAKSLGIVIQQNTKEFNAQVKVLMETEGLTKLQARAQVILTQAYDQSKNAIGDYARTAESTANMQRQLLAVQDDIITQIGSAFLPVVHDLTKSMLDAAKGFRDFLDEGDTIAKLGASFSVLVEIGKQLGGVIWQAVKDTFNEIVDAFKDLIPEGEKSSVVLTTIVGAIKILGVAFGISAKAVGIVIQAFVDFIKIGKESIEVAMAFWEGLVSGKWKEAWSAVKDLGNAYKEFGDNLTGGMADATIEAIQKLTSMPKEVEGSVNELTKIYDDAYNEILGKTEDTNAAIVAGEKQKNADVVADEAKALEKRKSILEEWENAQEKTFKDTIKGIRTQQKEFEDAGVAEADASKWATKEISKAYKDMAGDVLGMIGQMASAAVDTYQTIFDSVMDIQEQQLEAMIAEHEEELLEIDADKEAKLESLEDKYTREQEALQMQLDQGIITQEEFDLKENELKKKKEDEQERIEKDAEKKKKERKKKQTEEENAKKKEIFEANKKNQIAMIWINAAIGIVAAWAAAMSMGNPIAAIIMGAILTALIIAAAVAQTVVISQQTYIPEKAMGGMAGGPTRVNEQGGEIITLPDGSQVIPNDISQQIASNTGGTGQNISIYVNFKGAQIANDMDLRHITDYVSNEIARRLELTT